MEPLVAAGPNKGVRKTDPKMAPRVGITLGMAAEKRTPFFHPGRPNFHFWVGPRSGCSTHEWISFLHAQVLGGRPILRSNVEETSVKEYQDEGRGEPGRMSLLIAALVTLSVQDVMRSEVRTATTRATPPCDHPQALRHFPDSFRYFPESPRQLQRAPDSSGQPQTAPRLFPASSQNSSRQLPDSSQLCQGSSQTAPDSSQTPPDSTRQL